MTKKVLITVFFLLLLGSASAFDVWNQKASIPAVARHRTTSFSVGNKGYMGLGHYNSGPEGNVLLGDFWEYDPSSNSWTQMADFGGGLRYHAVGHGYGNKAYVGTGRSPGVNLNDDWWEFNPIANTWTPRANFPGTQRRGAVCFLMDDFIFLGTGETAFGYADDFYAYDITKDQWLGGVASFPGSARTSAVAFEIENKGYVGTGGVACGTIDFYEYKSGTNQWIQRANVGTLIRQEATGFAVNGKGYIGAGDNCSSGTNYKDFWEYDPQTDTWTEIQEFAGSARRYLDAFVIGSKAFCGLGTSGVNYSDLWEFDLVLSTLNRNIELVQIGSYPNPATNQTTIEVENLPSGLDYSELKIKVFNMGGQEILNETLQSSKIKVNRNNLKSGTFIYSVWYDGQELRQGKMIII